MKTFKEFVNNKQSKNQSVNENVAESQIYTICWSTAVNEACRESVTNLNPEYALMAWVRNHKKELSRGATINGILDNDGQEALSSQDINATVTAAKYAFDV